MTGSCRVHGYWVTRNNSFILTGNPLIDTDLDGWTGPATRKAKMQTQTRPNRSLHFLFIFFAMSLPNHLYHSFPHYHWKVYYHWKVFKGNFVHQDKILNFGVQKDTEIISFIQKDNYIFSPKYPSLCLNLIKPKIQINRSTTHKLKFL